MILAIICVFQRLRLEGAGRQLQPYDTILDGANRQHLDILGVANKVPVADRQHELAHQLLTGLVG
jgi:hypothetical protein